MEEKNEKKQTIQRITWKFHYIYLYVTYNLFVLLCNIKTNLRVYNISILSI